jgi:beta-N-acetylhexosaminidase
MPAVVLSLAFYAAYDSVTPAALSEPVATGLLRDQLGFAGVAITDDLGAGAVRSGYSVPKAAVAALAAGSDLIRIDAPEDQSGVVDAIAAAVDSGELDETRLQQAAARVLELKRVRGLTGM